MSKIKVALLLKDSHPLSAREIAAELDMAHSYARACVSYCKKQGLIHVHSYRRDEDGGRLYPRPLYSYGPGKHARKLQALPESAYRERYRLRKQTVGATDVFTLAVCVEKRRLTTRKRPDVAERRRRAAAGTVAGDE